jgi:formate--tetrahydrofolate ligase
MELAREVVKLCEGSQRGKNLRCSYADEAPIEEKFQAVVRGVYRGSGVELLPQARKEAKRFTELGYGKFPVCIAKTQYSFSDNPKLRGAPENFTITVRNLRLNAGAGFIAALTGDIMTMPGLPKTPAEESIFLDGEGNIQGLF